MLWVIVAIYYKRQSKNKIKPNLVSAAKKPRFFGGVKKDLNKATRRQAGQFQAVGVVQCVLPRTPRECHKFINLQGFELPIFVQKIKLA